MSVKLRSAKETIFLVGETNHQITGAKLLSNRQVLAVLFFNICEDLRIIKHFELPLYLEEVNFSYFEKLWGLVGTG